MTPPAHFLAGWLVAGLGGRSRRERIAVTVAGVIPDLDGLGYPIDWLTERFGWETHLYDWHHLLCHNGAFAALTVLGVFLAAGRKLRAAALAALAFHLHLVMDMIGSKGPDGDSWAVPYLLPFSDAWQLVLPFQWELDSWQNKATGVALLAAALAVTWWKRTSPLEVFSVRMDEALLGLMRRTPPPDRSGSPSEPG
ncbi:MAG: metal-dependent hydrolase [Planctomycetota bacterium]